MTNSDPMETCPVTIIIIANEDHRGVFVGPSVTAGKERRAAPPWTLNSITHNATNSAGLQRIDNDPRELAHNVIGNDNFPIANQSSAHQNTNFPYSILTQRNPPSQSVI